MSEICWPVPLAIAIHVPSGEFVNHVGTTQVPSVIHDGGGLDGRGGVGLCVGGEIGGCDGVEGCEDGPVDVETDVCEFDCEPKVVDRNPWLQLLNNNRRAVAAMAA